MVSWDCGQRGNQYSIGANMRQVEHATVWAKLESGCWARVGTTRHYDLAILIATGRQFASFFISWE